MYSWQGASQGLPLQGSGFASIRPSDYRLRVVQQPKLSRIAAPRDRDRKPIDPPPVVQLEVSERLDSSDIHLSSPYMFMLCDIVEDERVAPTTQKAQERSKKTTREDTIESDHLLGTIVSSLHRLKDLNNQDVAYFVFPDVSVKTSGDFRLQFTLYDLSLQHDWAEQADYAKLSMVTSDLFRVWSQNTFPGMEQSTFLTRALNDQGVRVRLRKEFRPKLDQRRTARCRDRSAERPILHPGQIKRQRTGEVEGPEETKTTDEAEENALSSISPSTSFGQHQTADLLTQDPWASFDHALSPIQAQQQQQQQQHYFVQNPQWGNQEPGQDGSFSSPVLLLQDDLTALQPQAELSMARCTSPSFENSVDSNAAFSPLDDTFSGIDRQFGQPYQFPFPYIEDSSTSEADFSAGQYQTWDHQHNHPS